MIAPTQHIRRIPIHARRLGRSPEEVEEILTQLDAALAARGPLCEKQAAETVGFASHSLRQFFRRYATAAAAHGYPGKLIRGHTAPKEDTDLALAILTASDFPRVPGEIMLLKDIAEACGCGQENIRQAERNGLRKLRAIVRRKGLEQEFHAFLAPMTRERDARA